MDMNIFSIGTGGVQIGVLDILCVALLVLAAISGWRRGFMRSLIGLLSFAASIVSAYLLRPIITDVLLGTSLSNTVYGRVLSGITAQIPDTSGMPAIFSGMINDGTAAAADGTAGIITKVIIGIIAFAVVYMAVRTVVLIASKLLITATKLPVIGSADKLLGLLAVTFKWTVLIYIALVAASVFAVPNGSGFLSGAVNNSQLCKMIQSGELVRNLFLN